FSVRGEGLNQRPQRPIAKAGVVRAGQGGRKNDGNAVEFFLEARGDLLGFAGRDGAGPSEPASLQFPMKGGEAGRNAAGIRLHIEAVSDSPNGDRETVRDEDENHVRKESVVDPLAVGRFVGGTSGSDSGIRDVRQQGTIMHNNTASQWPALTW